MSIAGETLNTVTCGCDPIQPKSSYKLEHFYKSAKAMCTDHLNHPILGRNHPVLQIVLVQNC